MAEASAPSGGGDGGPGQQEVASPGGASPPLGFATKAAEKAQELLDRLKAAFAESGVDFDPAWRIDIKHRATGTSAGTSDAYYYGPNGKRYRSRAEIARDYELKEEKPQRASGAGSSRQRAPKALPHGALGRAEAAAAAKARHAATQLPLALSSGVTVTTLGSVKQDPAYNTADQMWPAGFASEWTDEKGVRFVNSITETPSGPVFRVKAQRLASEGKPATEIVELGSGSTPDAAYLAASDRQQEALEVALVNRSRRRHEAAAAVGEEGAGASAPSSPAAPAAAAAGSSATRELDAAERLLVRCRPLSEQWGMERFGFTDVKVLQAIEGLPGAEECAEYKFVEEREGWALEARRVARDLAAHGKLEGRMPPAPRSDRRHSEAGDGEARKRRRLSKEESERNQIEKVIEHLIREVELGEFKQVAAEQRVRMKQERDLQRQAEKEKKRLEKQREREQHDAQREQQNNVYRQSFAEQQRRVSEANAVQDDATLPGASEPTPEPLPVASGRLPPHHQPLLLEAWQFAQRFAETLLPAGAGGTLPTLLQLEASLLGEAPAPSVPATGAQLPQKDASGGTGAEADAEEDAAVRLQMQLVEFLVVSLFHAAVDQLAGANSDITRTDLRATPKQQQPMPMRPDTWQEVCRRYLALHATAAHAQHLREGTHMPGHASPLAVLDPQLVLQYLTAGPAAGLGEGPACLPRHCARPAAHALVACADAAAVAAAEAQLAAAVGVARAADPDQSVEQQQLMRAILRQVANAKGSKRDWHGRTLCFAGQEAAAAAKAGRPLDLRGVGARLDAGVYAALPDPLAGFAADIKYICSLYQTACNKPHSNFAAEYGDKGAPETAALAVSKLESALSEVRQLGAADFLEHHAPPPKPRGSAGGHTPSAPASREPTPGPSAGSYQPELRKPADVIRDLERPFCPYRGCFVCWSEEDPHHVLYCSGCDCHAHIYCLDPPLEQPPSMGDPWLCPQCSSRAGGPKAPKAQEARPAPGSEDAWRLAQLLASTDYKEWSVEKRWELLRMLCTMCAESAGVHDTLHGEEDEVREGKKEIVALRQEQKRLQGEIAAAASGSGAAAAGGDGGAARPRPTRGRDPASELETLTLRISKLEHDITQVGPVRLEPVGMDRHYNRYWLLPAAADDAAAGRDAPPLLVVECHSPDPLTAAQQRQQQGAAAAQPGVWQVGVYRSIPQLQQLATWLNPKGAREKPLCTAVRALLDQHHRRAAALLDARREREAAELQCVAEARRRMEQRVASGELTAEEALAAAASERQPAAAAAAAGAQEGAAPGMPARPSAMLRSALLQFEEGWMPGTHDELRGSDARREQWRRMVEAADTPQALIAALVLLEQMVRPEWLKQHWRPWAQPAPHPAAPATYAAVWLRLEALKTAVKLKVTLKLALAKEALGGSLPGGGAGGRYALREQRPKRGLGDDRGSAPPSQSGSEDEGHETRAERAAKRARLRAASPDDEALARKLDAELNAGARRPSRLREGEGGEAEDYASRLRHPRAPPRQRQFVVGEDEEEWEDDGMDEDEEVSMEDDEGSMQ